MTRRTGFTLVEVVIVVMILGVLAGIAAPRMTGVSTRATTVAVVAEFDAIVTAVELYTADNGVLPPESRPGVCPEGLEDYLDPRVFAEETPVGGAWQWAQTAHGHAASLGVSGATASVRMLNLIDDRYDDGNPNSGAIRTTDGRLVFVVEPSGDAAESVRGTAVRSADRSGD